MESFSTPARLIPRVANTLTLAVIVSAAWWSSNHRSDAAGVETAAPTPVTQADATPHPSTPAEPAEAPDVQALATLAPPAPVVGDRSGLAPVRFLATLPR